MSKGTNSCNLRFKLKTKDLLGIYQYGYNPFCVSLLTDRHLKVRCSTDFVYIFRQRRVYVWLFASHVARKKLSHDILRYVSKFRNSEHDNFLLAKNHRENILKKNMWSFLRQHSHTFKQMKFPSFSDFPHPLPLCCSYYKVRIRIYLLARRNLLWDILRLLSSRRAALGLYVILTLWRARGANQPPYALLHRSSPRYALRHGRRQFILFKSVPVHKLSWLALLRVNI